MSRHDVPHIACDLDGTLAHYDHWRGIEHIGEPVAPVLAAVKAALARGWDVSIFTARVSGRDAEEAAAPIRAWCLEHIGVELPITATKFGHFTEFWDDRAVGLTRNTGKLSRGTYWSASPSPACP